MEITSKYYELINLTIDEIFSRLGSELNATNVAPRAGSDSDLGKKWWSIKGNEIKKKVCQNKSFLLGDPKKNVTEIEIFSGILDLISGSVYSVSPFTVAVLIMKFGVSNLCDDVSDKDC